MGRSPLFYSIVKPVFHLEPIEPLSNIFKFTYGNNECNMNEHIQIHISEPILIKITSSIYNPPILERSCSVYNGYEDVFPKIDNVYSIVSATRYTFCNQYSNNIPFSYDILDIKNSNSDYYSTFCIRTDGLVLNNESFTPRGIINIVLV